jgi:hypothetical protein
MSLLRRGARDAAAWNRRYTTRPAIIDVRTFLVKYTTPNHDHYCASLGHGLIDDRLTPKH